MRAQSCTRLWGEAMQCACIGTRAALGRWEGWAAQAGLGRGAEMGAADGPHSCLRPHAQLQSRPCDFLVSAPAIQVQTQRNQSGGRSSPPPGKGANTGGSPVHRSGADDRRPPDLTAPAQLRTARRDAGSRSQLASGLNQQGSSGVQAGLPTPRWLAGSQGTGWHEHHGAGRRDPDTLLRCQPREANTQSTGDRLPIPQGVPASP